MNPGIVRIMVIEVLIIKDPLYNSDLFSLEKFIPSFDLHNYDTSRPQLVHMIGPKFLKNYTNQKQQSKVRAWVALLYFDTMPKC